MRKVLVRYKVKAERAAENEAYIRSVFEELAAIPRTGLGSVSLTQDEAVGVARFDAAEGAGGPDAASSIATAFREKIRDRCASPPVAVEIDDISLD